MAALDPPLLRAGYHVLTVDLRGFGGTRGTRSMEGRIDDTRFWFEWLHAQPDVQGDALALVGAVSAQCPRWRAVLPNPAVFDLNPPPSPPAISAAQRGVVRAQERPLGAVHGQADRQYALRHAAHV
ncbi:MAG: hypothetical protein IPK17_21605 [Chloroflexi bacterium]|nr:hypothetical protein [Chloroflexota bacterium]